MVKYDLSSLEQKKKMAVIRELFGYEKRMNGKIYKKDGVIKESGGRKLKNRIFIVPKERTKDVLDYLKKMKVKFEIQEIWSEEVVK